ncbi:MAG: voltage-gated potassium channel [Algoriphagus sp.]|jgi:voltage-gated potassium channel
MKVSTKSLRKRTFEILSPHEKMNGLGFAVDVILSILILLNVLAISIESIDSIAQEYSKFFDVFEWFSVAIFTVEYLARLWSTPERTDLQGGSAASMRFRYMFSLMGLIDLLVLLPFFIRWFVPIIDLRWMRILRLIWLFKFSHFSPSLDLFSKAIYKERKGLISTIYLLLIVLVLSSSTIYFAENTAQPEIFHSIPEALWWSIMTLTTVGYGDAVPITLLGRVIGVFTAFLGICTFAMLTSILANGLYKETENKKKLLNTPLEDFFLNACLTELELEEMKEIKAELELTDDQTKKIVGILYKTPKRTSSIPAP